MEDNNVDVVTLDFQDNKISKLIFTKSREEAERLAKERGLSIYFPSGLTKEISSQDPVYVLADA